MIAELVTVVALAAGQDFIQADVSGSRRWRVVLEGPGGAVAYLPTAQDGETREVVLMTTAWLAESPGDNAALLQRFFVHTLDCEGWTQAQTGFGLTDPPPRRWTPRDGPPLSRPASEPTPIEPNTAMATIAEATCGTGAARLPEIEGDWIEVSTALRRRVEARSPALQGADDR